MDLSYGCSLIPLAHIDCKKDTYKLLEETIAPKICEDIELVKKSSAVIIYDKAI